MTGHCKLCNWAHTSLDVIKDRAISEVMDKVSRHFLEAHKDRMPEFKAKGQTIYMLASNLLAIKMIVTPGVNDREDFEEKEARLTIGLCEELGIELSDEEEEEDEDEEREEDDELEERDKELEVLEEEEERLSREKGEEPIPAPAPSPAPVSST